MASALPLKIFIFIMDTMVLHMMKTNSRLEDSYAGDDDFNDFIDFKDADFNDDDFNDDIDARNLPTR